MGGLFNRIKVWIFKEVLKSKDLNAELDNIINHMAAQYITGFSQTIAQMQDQLNPGGLGSELPAASVAQEIEQLRFVIARITGLPFWYQSAPISLSDANTLLRLGIGIPDNRIVSGLSVSSSSLANFLLADGTTNKVTLKAGGSNPNLIAFIEDVQYTFTADIPFMGLSLAPSSNNTATVNDANIVNDLYAGETDYTIPNESIGAPITIASAGTAITAKIGQFAAFKVVDGGITEYFIGYVSSSTTIENVFRGYFFDNTGTPIKRNALNNGDTLSLMQLSWLFLTTSGTLDVTYNNPVYATVAPSSPAPGDYWFNLNTQVWSKFTGAAFVDAHAVFAGVCIQDTTKTVAARATGFFAAYQQLNTMNVGVTSNTEVQALQAYSSTSASGVLFNFGPELYSWNTPINLDTGVTIGASATYWLYISEKGQQFISDQKPYNQVFDLLGWYHPYNSWRAIASVATDGSSHFVSVFNYSQIPASLLTDYSINRNKIFPRTNTFSLSSVNSGLGGVAVSAGISSFSTTSATSVGVPGSTTTLVTAGGPVFVMLCNDTSTNPAEFSTNNAVATYEARIEQNGVIVFNAQIPFFSASVPFPVSFVAAVALAPAGDNSYELFLVSDGIHQITITNTRLMVYEV